MFANGFEDLIERQILLPLLAVPSIVSGSGAIQPQEPSEAVRIQFSFENLKGMPLELLVR